MILQIYLLLRKKWPIFSFILGIVWLSNLAPTDAYFSGYTLLAFLSFYLQIRSYLYSPLDNSNSSGFVWCLSGLFSGLVLLANYPLFTEIGDPALIGRSTSILVNLINGCLTFLGGIFVFHPILLSFFNAYPRKCGNEKYFRAWIPVAFFSSIFLLHLIHLLLVEYPGNLTEDSFSQISEMVSGSYSNYNTYWHTFLFQIILTAGYRLFSDVNAAVFLFVLCQMTLLVFAFTFCLISMIEYGVPKYVVAVTYLLFAVVPYNMALTVTVWKDVLFAGGCLLMLSAWVRIRFQLGKYPVWNWFVFAAGSLLFILARTNGWIIYLVTFLICLLFCRRDKKILVLLCFFSVIGWFLLNPALSMLDVKGGDPVESLSIPIQQVSRVIVEGGTLTEEEEILLSRIVDLEEVPALYTSWLSDPMKVEVRSKDYSYFLDHIDEYRMLWIRLGLRYPWQYLKAWIDQTKGYWNVGYDYPLYSETITDNPYGIEKLSGNNPIASLFRIYFGLSRHLIFFEPLHSIGLHIWLLWLSFLLNVKRRRDTALNAVPLLLLVTGLSFGTPVYSCFRYVYPVFVSLPLILSTALWEPQR